MLLWTLLPLVVGRAPPNDNLEQLEWSRTLAWGYAKHPPLPTWELIAAAQIFPKGLPLTYALGALQVVVMLGFAWAIARELLGAGRACVALLLVSCVHFYTHRIHYLNHNTLLLSAWAASTWCALRALRGGGLGWWIALGASWGIGMLAKYQMVVGIASTLACIALSAERSWGERLRGVAVATIVSLAVFLPHGLWIVSDRFTTLSYATSWVEASRGPIDRVLDVLQFGAEQIGRLAAALIACGVLVLLARRMERSSSAPPPATGVTTGVSALDRRFLLWHAWGPFGFMALLSLVIGLDLGQPWGTAFLWMLPIVLMSGPLGARLERLPRTALFGTILVVQALLIAGFR